MDYLVFPSLHSGPGQARVVSDRFLEGWGLFELGQHITENIEEDVNMVLLKNQRRAETDWSIPAPSQDDTYERQTLSVSTQFNDTGLMFIHLDMKGLVVIVINAVGKQQA